MHSLLSSLIMAKQISRDLYAFCVELEQSHLLPETQHTSCLCLCFVFLAYVSEYLMQNVANKFP